MISTPLKTPLTFWPLKTPLTRLHAGSYTNFMARTVAVDLDSLIRDAAETVQSELRNLKNVGDDGEDVLDPAKRSQRIGRAVSATRALVAEIKELQERQREEYSNASEVDLMATMLAHADGLTLAVEALRGLGWRVEPPEISPGEVRREKRRKVMMTALGAPPARGEDPRE